MGRNRATKPTRDQKIQMVAGGLVVKNWLVLSDTAAELKVVSRASGQSKRTHPAATGRGPGNKKFHTPIIQGNRRKCKMAKTLKVTPDNRIQVAEVDFNRIEDIQREIGGYVERVCTRKLQEYFKSDVMMIVDEEGLLKGLPMNPTGSVFYDTARHGNPIVGDFVLAVLDGENWKAPEEKQLEEWKARLKKDFWLKE